MAKALILRQKKRGMGLNSIEPRVKELDGNIDINSTPDKGTYIYMEFRISETTPGQVT
jgi:signal transduction histidine kinase